MADVQKAPGIFLYVQKTTGRILYVQKNPCTFQAYKKIPVRLQRWPKWHHWGLFKMIMTQLKVRNPQAKYPLEILQMLLQQYSQYSSASATPTRSSRSTAALSTCTRGSTASTFLPTCAWSTALTWSARKKHVHEEDVQPQGRRVQEKDPRMSWPEPDWWKLWQ